MPSKPVEHKPKKCIICGSAFVPRTRLCVVCSEECRAENQKRRCRDYEHRHRQERNRKMREVRQERMKAAYSSGHTHCRFCGEELNRKRPSKEYCDSLCRQRMYRALATGEKIPAEITEREWKELLSRLNLKRMARKTTRKSPKKRSPTRSEKPLEAPVNRPLVTVRPTQCKKEDWKKRVEFVMNLPYDKRWEYSSKWNAAERNYAKSIELKRLGCGIGGW